MTTSDILSCSMQGNHSAGREGVRLGLIVATVIWLWIALVDAVMGHPFHTFEVLGGIIGFTIIHYILCMLYGVALIAVVHGAEDTASLVFGLIFCGLIFEGGFAMLTNVLAAASLGNVAWMGIFGGNLIGAAIAFALIVWSHPVAVCLQRAEAER